MRKFDFGLYIRGKRIERRLSLIEASERIGKGKTWLSDLENNKITRPKMEDIERVSAAYGLNLDDTVVKAGRIPAGVYWKIVNNPEIINLVRELDVSEI